MSCTAVKLHKLPYKQMEASVVEKVKNRLSQQIFLKSKKQFKGLVLARILGGDIVLNSVNVYFSDFFNVDEDVIESYGAINVSLINDLPLFIDPFLLFNSDRSEYQQIHQEMINYLLFLQKQAEIHSTLTAGHAQGMVFILGS